MKVIKESSDFLYLRNLWDMYEIESSKKERILLLKEISFYPYYAVTNKKSIDYFRALYTASIWSMIREYEGDVENLKRIKINLGYQGDLYPMLRRSILRGGGTWDRGELRRTYSR